MPPDHIFRTRDNRIPLHAVHPRDRDEIIEKKDLPHTRDQQQITG